MQEPENQYYVPSSLESILNLRRDLVEIATPLVRGLLNELDAKNIHDERMLRLIKSLEEIIGSETTV